MKKIKFGKDIKKIKTLRKWLICYCDHYKGNNKGFYIRTKDIKNTDSHWFEWHKSYADRNITTAYLTNLDVPSVIKKRKAIIDSLIDLKHKEIVVWMDLMNNEHYLIDGRFTPKSKPHLFIKKDEVEKEAEEKSKGILLKIEALQKKIDKIPYISTKLYKI